MIDYSKYLRICKEASENKNVFKDFKRHPDYFPILEHVNYQQGIEYISEIKRIFPVFLELEYTSKFLMNDMIGNPNIYQFTELGIKISPTTLRYIKVLADLVSLFGNLNKKNIVEIGGGYGGQCKIINSIYNPESYTLVDLPEVLILSEKYLKDINNVIFRNTDDQTTIHYDICISNYAFTEIERKYQIFYADKIINNSDRGYITCNFIANDNLSKEEIFALKSNHTVYEEKPLTGDGNLIYTWES